MLEVHETCTERMLEAVELATKHGDKSLQENITYLEHYRQDTCKCVLYRDWAPFSFEFIMFERKGEEWVQWFNGGLIYHGPHDGGGNGSAPTFSVCLTPTDGWSIHT